MNTEDYKCALLILTSLFSKSVCIELFGESSGSRLWDKHYLYHSKSDFAFFNVNFEKFADGKFADLRPLLDKWLHDTIAIALVPRGFKLVRS